MAQLPLSREQLKKAYDIFNDITGGLKDKWIHDEKPDVPAALKTMYGRPGGEQKFNATTWTEVYVDVKDPSTEQLLKWEDRRDELECESDRQYLDEDVVRLIFSTPEMPWKDDDQQQGSNSSNEE